MHEISELPRNLGAIDFWVSASGNGLIGLSSRHLCCWLENNLFMACLSAAPTVQAQQEIKSTKLGRNRIWD
jgi:hypothetical protein